MVTNPSDDLRKLDESDVPDVPLDSVAEDLIDSLNNQRTLYTRLLTGSVLSMLVAVAALAFVATRPPKVIYLRINEMGQVQRTSPDAFSYSPQAPEIRRSLNDWARFRYARTRASIINQFSKNYLFLDKQLAAQLMRTDAAHNLVADVATGRTPESDIDIRNTIIRSIGRKSFGQATLFGGEATIEFVMIPSSSFAVKNKSEWAIDVHYVLNPNQDQGSDYQNINPLGLVITEMHENEGYSAQ